jgi:two-component system chemotaxis sensor kinase CheA
MDKDKLIHELMVTFLGELDEHVQALNRDLLALEKHPCDDGRAELLTTLFRTAHSLKGAARSVSLPLIEGVCHRLEEILAAARDDRLSLDPHLFQVLFATTDAIGEAAIRLRENRDLDNVPLGALLPMLDAAVSTTAAARPTAHLEAFDSAAMVFATKTPHQTPPSQILMPEADSSPHLPSDRTSRIEDCTLSTELPKVRPRTGTATVRVPAEKLDALLAHSGELLVARRRVKSRAEELTALREFVARWKTDWQVAEKPLRRQSWSGRRFKQSDELEISPAGHAIVNCIEGDRHLTTDSGPLPRRTLQEIAKTGDKLRRLEKEVERLAGSICDDVRLLDQAGGRLDDEVDRVRMLPFAEACQGLERNIRDLAYAETKEVELVIEGGELELDRSILQGLKDPLLHLVRNAVDHGIEPAEKRRAAGKPPRGRITVAAALRGAQVEVVVTDDGRGLDLQALRNQLRKRHLPVPADEQELVPLVFLPGISTAEIITDVSGRGVGLDIVKSHVESLLGSIDLVSEPGRGTRFTLTVPLTLTTLQAVLVESDGQTFAIPGTHVHRFVRLDPRELRSIEGRQMVSLGGAPILVASLGETLGLQAHEPVGPCSKMPALVVSAGDQRVAFVVDALIAQHEVVVKNLGSRIRRVRNVSGATLLPSGRIALVVNAQSLVRTAQCRTPTRTLGVTAVETAEIAKKRLLVVDDSVTTRSLVKSILEATGYDVAVAADGAAAWQLLQNGGADLVVSDVEMPRMDGFALTEAIRGSKRLRDLPVILVTARETDQDKARGIAVGANAYLGKSTFDQGNLLQTLAQLL